MIRIDVREGAGTQEVTLTSAQASLLSAAQAVRIWEGPRPGVWRVRDNGLVGAARFGSGADTVEVRIAPKIDIRRLLFLVGYALGRGGWREPEVAAVEHPDLLPAVALAFARAAERALRHGVLLGYREMEDALPTVRGRIRESEQLRRRYGVPLPVEVRHDDYTIDIAANQLLRGAAVRLLRLPGVPDEVRKQLRRLLLRLDGAAAASPPVRGADLPRWRPSRLNARYHTALGLAELVLRGGSYELDDGASLRVDGLLLRMWQVFEDFVTRALADALRPDGGHCQRQDNSLHLDRAHRVRLRPDLVYYRVATTGRKNAAAVVDVKYKIGRDARGHNPDLYQMLAYSTVLGLPRGHLVYAHGEAEPTTHAIYGPQGIEIMQHAIDLSQPLTQLREQIQRLAAQLVTEPDQKT